MPEPFVSLAHYLQRSEEPAPSSVPCEAVSAEETTRSSNDPHDVRRFYACIEDAVETARGDLLRDLAASVLARELALQPVELARVASSVLARFAEQEPLHVLAHPDDVARLHAIGVAVRPGAGLRRGDLTLVLQYGSIDASLGARLADVLAAHAA